MTCAGKDRNLLPCRVNMKNGEKFCKTHKYMEEYTEEMMNHLLSCSSCKNAKYLGDSKTCDTCKARSKQNRKSVVKLPKCAVENCKSQRSVENQYCRIHQLHLLVDEVTSRNKRLCVNYIRGCRTEMDLNDKYKKCHECRTAESAKERARRQAVKDLPPEELTCTTCRKKYDDASVFEHVGLGTTTKTCAACREQFRIQNERRDKEHVRELARKNEAKESRKEQKRGWANSNWDKVASRWLRYRQRRMNEDYDGYLQKNAAVMKQWRERNPDKVHAVNEHKKHSLHLQYNVYSRSAQFRGVGFELTRDEYVSIAQSVCYYCSTEDANRGFNGVDRIDSSNGYFIDNCVACCKICNYMKGSLHKDVFLKRVEHILTHNGLVEGALFPECFANTKLVKYSAYEYYTNRINRVFEITAEQFKEICSNDCYLCGKENMDSEHMNGIDRYDNTRGYVLDNCKSCCKECNFMKCALSYDTMMNTFMKIYDNHGSSHNKDTTQYGIKKCERRTTCTVKRTIDDRLHDKEQRKKMQLEKYNDPQWIQSHSCEIANTKRNK